MAKHRRRGSGRKGVRPSLLVPALVLVAVAVLVTSAVVIHRSSSDRPKGGPNDDKIAVAQRFVRQQIHAESVRFGTNEETTVVKLGPDDYRVSGYVFANDPEGKRATGSFSCDIHHSAGGAWSASNVVILPTS